jgi:hypothetical protein
VLGKQLFCLRIDGRSHGRYRRKKVGGGSVGGGRQGRRLPLDVIQPVGQLIGTAAQQGFPAGPLEMNARHFGQETAVFIQNLHLRRQRFVAATAGQFHGRIAPGRPAGALVQHKPVDAQGHKNVAFAQFRRDGGGHHLKAGVQQCRMHPVAAQFGLAAGGQFQLAQRRAIAPPHLLHTVQAGAKIQPQFIEFGVMGRCGNRFGQLCLERGGGFAGGGGLWLVGLETAVGVQLPRRIWPSRFRLAKNLHRGGLVGRRRHEGVHNAGFICPNHQRFVNGEPFDGVCCRGRKRPLPPPASFPRSPWPVKWPGHARGDR